MAGCRFFRLRVSSPYDFFCNNECSQNFNKLIPERESSICANCPDFESPKVIDDEMELAKKLSFAFKGKLEQFATSDSETPFVAISFKDNHQMADWCDAFIQFSEGVLKKFIKENNTNDLNN